MSLPLAPGGAVSLLLLPLLLLLLLLGSTLPSPSLLLCHRLPLVLKCLDISCCLLVAAFGSCWCFVLLW
jgi:hypothetical protein